MGLPVSGGSITAVYGPTNEPLDSGYKGYAHFNKGLDIGVPSGTPVSAVTDGTVVSAGWLGGGWGYRVIIRDADGNLHGYGHLTPDSARVKVGDRVRAGQSIALSGNSSETGASTGAHLSYDVQDASGEWIPPDPFLGFNASGDNWSHPAIGRDISEMGEFSGGQEYESSENETWGKAADQIDEYLSVLTANAPNMKDSAYQIDELDTNGNPTGRKVFDSAAYYTDLSTYTGLLTQMQQASAAMRLSSFGMAQLPDGSVVPTGSLTPEQREAINTANLNNYNGLLNQLAMDEHNLLADYNTAVNQNAQNTFSNDLGRLNAAIALDELDFSRAAKQLDRSLEALAHSRAVSQQIQDAKDQARTYGTLPGKSSFTASDLGGGIEKLASYLGMSPSDTVLRYPGTQTYNPEGDVSRIALALGVDANKPLPEIPMTGRTTGMEIPTGPSFLAPPTPPELRGFNPVPSFGTIDFDEVYRRLGSGASTGAGFQGPLDQALVTMGDASNRVNPGGPQGTTDYVSSLLGDAFTMFGRNLPSRAGNQALLWGQR